MRRGLWTLSTKKCKGILSNGSCVTLSVITTLVQIRFPPFCLLISTWGKWALPPGEGRRLILEHGKSKLVELCGLGGAWEKQEQQLSTGRKELSFGEMVPRVRGNARVRRDMREWDHFPKTQTYVPAISPRPGLGNTNHFPPNP